MMKTKPHQMTAPLHHHALLNLANRLSPAMKYPNHFSNHPSHRGDSQLLTLGRKSSPAISTINPLLSVLFFRNFIYIYLKKETTARDIANAHPKPKHQDEIKIVQS
ncbi:hypothetical protein [Riemerella columbina]|uniref:hypothetical protein n=1 Tax=Riemerella columbina TaxID=103810 RepID=UPI0026700D97|nr:hypothetical protein [Riemerella columbina]WKS95802.1 hypothetical protein NYR17_03415 [Riemerella columbina]